MEQGSRGSREAASMEHGARRRGETKIIDEDLDGIGSLLRACCGALVLWWPA